MPGLSDYSPALASENGPPPSPPVLAMLHRHELG